MKTLIDTPSNALSIESDVRLVGTNFDGIVLDSNFWKPSLTGSGGVAQAGGVTLTTGVTLNSTVMYDSVRRARFVVSSPMRFQAIAKFATEGTDNNIRRIGAYDDDNGFFMQLDGSTFSIGFRKAGADTFVNSGSFNGNYGTCYVMDALLHKLAIEWTVRGVFFYIDGKLLHKDSAGQRSNLLTLPIRLENSNDAGQTVDVSFLVLGAVIMRLGELITNSAYYHLSGNADTHVLKIGAGTLQKIVFNNISGTSLTIYDGVDITGNIIGIITTTIASIGSWIYDMPFSDGLTLVTVGNGLDASISYE